MQFLRQRIWSHNTKDVHTRETIGKIRSSKPKYIKTFPRLVEEIATISYHNPDLNLFFRGQSRDYKDSREYSSILPSIYRGIKGLYSYKDPELEFRSIRLRSAEELLLEAFNVHELEGHDKLLKFREVKWAILQHYKVCETPLVDLTSSLRVACSFALQHDGKSGYVSVLGFPHINGSISYYVEEELLIVKLLSICPPKAVWPYFQDGYLVGTFPTVEPLQSTFGMDIACRLVAKYRIPREGFWKKEFPEISQRALFPPNDDFEKICREISQRLT